MSSASEAAKQAILGAIRAAQPDASRVAVETITQRAQALALEMRAVRPQPAIGPVLPAFLARVASDKVGASVACIADLHALPSTVARYIAQHQLGARIAVQPHPQLLALDWGALTCAEQLRADETLAISLARAGIAETGSLIFHSGADTPVLQAFLPEHHLVAVYARDLLSHLEDYTDSALAHRTAPRNVNFITGASGTTDIEGVLVRGAHGPRALHIVVVMNY